MQSAADAYSALQNFSAPNAQDVLTQANNQYGVAAGQTRVSDLNNSVNNLTSSLNAVDPSVTGRTSGTFTTEGQRAALVNKEQAPIQQNLGTANTNLSAAKGDLSTDESNANNYASTIMSSDQQQYQKLLDQYNASSAYEKQQQDEANAQAQLQESQAQDAEKTREFNATLAASKSSSSYLPSASASTATPQAFSSFKNGKDASGGTAFTNATGQSISAATYASLTGNSIASVIQKLGQGGDKYAQQAYDEISSNQAYYSAHPDVLKSEFAPLFWGT